MRRIKEYKYSGGGKYLKTRSQRGVRDRGMLEKISNIIMSTAYEDHNNRL